MKVLSEVSFDVPSIFAMAFGYLSPAFALPQKRRFSELGSPYYGKDEKGRDYYMPAKLGGIILPHPVIRVSGSKTITRTEMVEARGTVKELINISDYQITIRGLIIDPDKEYPERIISELRELAEEKTALSLESAITDIFLVTPDRAGFDKVVIEAWDFPEVTGVTNVRPYELRLVSDEQYSLELD